jgi:catechol 2,3-dioxygenase-like lactoylglutathione lyase family enzyme
MLDHIGITVSDLERSKEFYRTALGPLRYELLKQTPSRISFGVTRGHGKSSDPGGDFWMSPGSPHLPRLHIAFNASSHAEVDSFFAAALAAGGVSNGPPGSRSQWHPHYYAAFVLDPDGYNIEAVCHAADSEAGL